MPKKAAKKPAPVLTTAQRLGGIIKSARNIMRIDKGLNGDLDRLPLFTWILFLKFLDDMEITAEDEAKLSGKKYQPVIAAPYRWRDWAAKVDGITGDELLKFISQDETMRPDGSKGAGLFAYLRGLSSDSGKSRQDVIANVFKGVTNRMESGYLLRDVLNKVNGIHFTASEEMHTLSRLYENMLKEMRDAAGDSGEFYTPRPVVKFMVEVTNPVLGDTVLDPACGTGGFLVEAYDHLAATCQSVKDRNVLQKDTLFGQEAKPLPYMLVQMNLLLHGLEYPNIQYGNTLATKVTEIGDADRVDVILTNPPFGGQEGRGILNNFPADKQTAETALLFLQLIMRKLRRPVRGNPGRAAIVVPNGTLFGDGVCARIKEELLKEYNLHTIVRLPEGTFAPYTDIPANLLFFDRSGPTETIWYYQVPLPEGRKKYSKTQPMQPEDLAACKAWFTAKKRVENEQAWKIDFKALLKKATKEAEPHWQAAQEAASRAGKLERQAKETKEDLRGSKDAAQKAKLQARLEELEASAAKERTLQSSEQAAGDAIYWPLFNLDRKNPRSADALEHRPPAELVKSILEKEQEILRLMEELSKLQNTLPETFYDSKTAITWKPMSEVAPLTWRQISIKPEAVYTEFGVRSFYKGIFLRRKVAGSTFSWQELYKLKSGDLVFSNIMAWEKAIAIARPEHDGWVGNHRMLVCEPRTDLILPSYLLHYFMTAEGFAKILRASPGTAARNKTLKADNLMAIEVPIPPLSYQRAFESLCEATARVSAAQQVQITETAKLIPSLLVRLFNT